MVFSKKIFEMLRKMHSSECELTDDSKNGIENKQEVKIVESPISLIDVKDEEELEMITQCISRFEVSSNGDSVDFSITVPKEYEGIWRKKLGNLTLMQGESENAN